jgi:hypothetical protein
MYAVQLSHFAEPSKLSTRALIVKTNLNSRQAVSAQRYGFGVGEHVYVEGRSGEFIVVEVDREQQMLQLLPLGRVGRLEGFPAASVRIVMPPKPKVKSKEEVVVDRFEGPTAA